MEHLVLSLLAVASVHVVAVITPGPNFLIITRNALRYSAHVGLLTARGVALGTTLYVTAGFIGFAAVIAQSALAFNLVKWLGAAYLIALGCRSLLARHVPTDFAAGAETLQPALNDRQAFLSGFFTCMSNPKSALYFLVLFTTFLSPSVVLGQKVLTGLLLVTISLSWYTLVALTFSRGRVQRFYRRFERWINYAFGGLWVALGLKLAASTGE